MMMEDIAWDENIPFSVQETDGFRDISRGITKEIRNEGGSGEGAQPPDPYYGWVTNQTPGTRAHELPLSEIWGNTTQHFWQLWLNCGEGLYHLYQLCIAGLNACKSLLHLIRSSCKLIMVTPRRAIRWFVTWIRNSRFARCFTKKKTRHGTDLTEVRVLIDDEEHEGTL